MLVEYTDPTDHQWFYDLAGKLLETHPIHTREWQSQDTSNSPLHATRELLNVSIQQRIPPMLEDWVILTRPSLPWADEHFAERVSGIPHNPPPSHVRWPWARFDGNAGHMADQRFSHTYPERLWPKHANHDPGNCQQPAHNIPCLYGEGGRMGIRYHYGDLDDVVNLLAKSPLTRQAFIPIWFPEDTGNLDEVRVPCTIGYHLMIRHGQMHCWYPMRSCDLVRHLRNDVYMAGRLVQWVCELLNDNITFREVMRDGVVPGTLQMTISSLHAFVGDDWRLRKLSRGDES
jgi:hypothetical protein